MARLTNNILAALRIMGNVLSIFAVYFLINKILAYQAEFSSSYFTIFGSASLIFITVLSGTVNHALSLAWWLLLTYYSPHVKKNTAVLIYGQSLIGKYIPGNIFQFAARHVAGLQKGVGGWHLGSASLAEILLLASLPLLCGLWMITDEGHLDWIWIDEFIFPAVASLTCLAVFFSRSWRIMGVLILYFIFFTVTGAIFASIVWTISTDILLLSSEFVLLIVIFAVGWFAGFITPGAPAGLGVREVAIIFLAGGRYPENDLVFAVAVSRLASALGDFGYWMWAHFKLRSMEGST